MQFADTLYKVYFMERNVKLIVDYTPSWPLMSFPAFIIPEVLHIWLLSEKLGIRSPVPKLPLVYPGQDYKTKHFGWSGSIGFSEAALISKKLISKEPSSIPETAVQQVLFEIEEAMSSSTSFDNGISEIEICTARSCPCIVQENISSTSSSADLTSPMPARKNRSKSRKKDHSNKGSVGSHKIDHQKLQLSVKVINNIKHAAFKVCTKINSCF